MRLALLLLIPQVAFALRYPDIKYLKQDALDVVDLAYGVLMVQAHKEPGPLADTMREFYAGALAYHDVVSAEMWERPDYVEILAKLKPLSAAIAERLAARPEDRLLLEDWQKIAARLDRAEALVKAVEPEPLHPYTRKTDHMWDVLRGGPTPNDVMGDTRLRVDEDGDVQSYDVHDCPKDYVDDHPEDDRFRVDEDGDIEEYDVDDDPSEYIDDDPEDDRFRIDESGNIEDYHVGDRSRKMRRVTRDHRIGHDENLEEYDKLDARHDDRLYYRTDRIDADRSGVVDYDIEDQLDVLHDKLGYEK